MTVPTRRATPTLTTGAAQTGITFTEAQAGNPVSGSIIVAVIYMESGSDTITPPAGWSGDFNGTTLTQVLTTPNTWKAAAFWIRRGGSAPSYAFTWTSTPYTQGAIASYDGAVASGDPWSFGAETVRDTGAAATFPSVGGTTSGIDELLIWIGMNYLGVGTVTQPTGYGSPTASGDIAWAEKTQATAASVTASGASWSGTGNGNASAMLASLKPADTTINIAYVGKGAKSAGGTTTISVAYPSPVASGELALACRAIWLGTATASDETGWTNTADLAGGTGTGNDAHTTRVRVDRQILAGTETGSVTFDQAGTPGGALGIMLNYSKDPAQDWDVAAGTGDDATHGTARAATSSTALDLAVGDVVVAVVAVDTDTNTAFTSPAITASGITFGTTTERVDLAGGVITGNDGNVAVYDARVTSGTGTVAPSLALTGGPSTCGPVAFVRLRQVSAGVDLAGTATAASSATGSFDAARPVAANSSAAGGATGAASVARPIAATASAANGATAVGSVGRAIAATTAAANGATGAVVADRGMAANASAAADLDADTVVARAVAGTSAAAADASGDVTVTAGGGAKALAGSGAAAAAATGTLGAARPVDGQATAANGATATTLVGRAVAATAAAAAGAAGDLTVTAGGIAALAGNASAANGSTAALTATRPLAATSSAANGATGTSSTARAVAATASAANAATAALTVTPGGVAALAGNSPAAAGATGLLASTRPFTATTAAAAGLSATATLARRLATTSSAAATAQGSLTTVAPAVGNVATGDTDSVGPRASIVSVGAGASTRSGGPRALVTNAIGGP